MCESIQEQVLDKGLVWYEDGKIHIDPEVAEDSDNLKVLCYLPMLVDGMSDHRTYELVVNGKGVATVKYNGAPEQPSFDGSSYNLGSQTIIEFYEKVEMVKIDLVLNENEDGGSK